MSNKRQTVWLVSMLSLMVILSAYYLFTDNPQSAEYASDPGVEDWAGVGGEPAGGQEHGVVLEEELWEDAGWTRWEEGDAEEVNPREDSEKEEKAGEKEGKVSREESILRKVQAGAERGDEYFAVLDMERTEQLARKAEELMDIATDPQRSSDEVGKAEAELHQLEEMQAKVSDLEDEFMQQYKNVVISETDGKWRVVVQTDNLQRSEAVTIIDKVIAHLGVKPGQIVVQFVP